MFTLLMVMRIKSWWICGRKKSVKCLLIRKCISWENNLTLHGKISSPDWGYPDKDKVLRYLLQESQAITRIHTIKMEMHIHTIFSASCCESI